jgi:hypothetical protein
MAKLGNRSAVFFVCSAATLVLAAASGCGSESAVTGAPTADGSDLPATGGLDGVAGQLPGTSGAIVGGALAFPTQVSLFTETAYPQVVEQEESSKYGPGLAENFVVLTALFGTIAEEKTLNLGILAGSRADLRIRDDGTVVLTELFVRMQDIHFARHPKLPSGLYLTKLMLRAPRPMYGTVTGRSNDRVTIELMLDLDLSLSMGASLDHVAEIPPVEIRGFPLLIQIERELGADGAPRFAVSASGVAGKPLLDVPNLITVNDAWLDMTSRVKTK